jgi:hypothetical protein
MSVIFSWVMDLKDSPKKSGALYAVLVWMIVNVVFYALELTVFNDAADLNNSIMLVLWVVSTLGVVLMKKWGAALAAFTLTYAFAFNVFNVIYYQIYLLNGISATINAVAAAYLFKTMFENKYR